MQGKADHLGRSRRRWGRGLPALLLALAVSGPALAEAAVPSTPLPAFHFATHTDAWFTAERRAGLDALVAAHDPAGLEAARMQLATLYLAHLMLPEARSLLDAVDPTQLDADGRARLGAMKAGVRIMSGKPLAADMADSPLVESNKNWKDYAFWSTLNAIRAKDKDGIRAGLPAALSRLNAYPAVYAETCLPLFFSAALDIGDWDLARTVAERFDGYPELETRPVYKYLLGRAALGVNRVDAARQAFGEAAQGQGPYAQRALLALVDLGLAGKSMSPAQAQILLRGSLADWQGGEIELEALRKLVHVDRLLADWPDMALTLGRLLRDFPDSEDASPAAKQADGLISAYYQFAIDGKVPLERLLSLHRHLVPLYRFDKAFEDVSEKLADHLLALGATAMAAQEYARIYDTLRLGQEAGKWTLDAPRLARLKLAEAEALAAGGRYAEAAAAQALAGAVPPALQDRAKALAARIDTARGDAAAAAGVTLAEPSASDLRMLASAASAAGDWSAARDRYQKLWSDYPGTFGEPDAINLLLAAARLKDHKTARAVTAAYPDLGGSAHWGRLVGAVLDSADKPLSPLSERAATDRLSGAQQVIDGVGGALGDGAQAGGTAPAGASKAKN